MLRTPTATSPTAATAPRRPVGWRHRLPYPVRTLLGRWRELVGMVIGVGIALSIAMTIMAINRGMRDLLAGDFAVSGADLYAITAGGTLIGLLPGEGPGTIAAGGQELATIRRLPQVTTAVGVIGWPLEREREGQRHSEDEPAELVAALGVDGDPQLIPRLTLLKAGRWLRRGDEIVVGGRFSREKGVSLGDRLRLAGRDFTIVGIGRLRGVAGLSADQLVYLEAHAFRERAGIGEGLNVIVIDTPQPAAVQARLREQSPLSVTDSDALARQAEASFAERMVTSWLMSLLVLGIAALFVSTVLGRSVAERRLDFATLKAIGLPTRTILLIVVLDALAISLVASLLAIGLSLLFGLFINGTLADFYGFESLYTADASAFLGVFGLALVTGLVAGLRPARRATRVDPVDILREA